LRFPFLLLCGALPLVAAQPAFTIEQVLSAPFPEQLVSAPRGDAVAWVQNAAGARNVWVAKAPAFTGAQITTFTGDDGQEINDLVWSPDETRLYFTRGGDPNSRGEIPNPRHDPAGEHQEIWHAPLTGTPKKLADGHAPAPSPDGRVLAFLLGGQIWSLDLARTDAKPAQMIHARGGESALTWSPDSSKLAFVSSRGDHAFIGVFEVRGSAVRYLDPSVDTDRFPSWSPDGQRLAFVRVPASTEFEFGARPTGTPWSIHVFDMRSGKRLQQWRAAEGKGSVFWPLASRDQLSWMQDGSIVFPWERDGWLHLYDLRVDAGTRTPALLTPGDFEVEHVAAASDRRSVIYSSNQDDPERRHLWRVGLDGTPPRWLTSGAGIEWTPVALDGNGVAFLHSDARQPARAAMLQTDSSVRDLAPSTIPADFPTKFLREPQSVNVTATDEMRVHGEIFLPPDDNNGTRHPALIFFHGGSRRQMLLGWHYMGYYNNAYGFNQYLASKGYVVLALNYRSGIGYGLDFREAPHYGATGASEFNDVLGAAAWLRDRSDVDASRIGAWGGSYGGYLTALSLARASATFAAGVDMHGVHDWNLEVTTPAPARDREKRQALEKTAFDSSPMASVSTWRSPVLLIQGDDDRTVAFAQTVQLTEALRKQGVHVEQLIFPDEVHDFVLHSSWLTAYHAADEFLSRYLKP
jgi:dipeptidyl aminopeptidase/acylaminoacyl peptidase